MPFSGPIAGMQPTSAPSMLPQAPANLALPPLFTDPNATSAGQTPDMAPSELPKDAGWAGAAGGGVHTIDTFLRSFLAGRHLAEQKALDDRARQVAGGNQGVVSASANWERIAGDPNATPEQKQAAQASYQQAVQQYGDLLTQHVGEPKPKRTGVLSKVGGGIKDAFTGGIEGIPQQAVEAYKSQAMAWTPAGPTPQARLAQTEQQGAQQQVDRGKKIDALTDQYVDAIKSGDAAKIGNLGDQVRGLKGEKIDPELDTADRKAKLATDALQIANTDFYKNNLMPLQKGALERWTAPGGPKLQPQDAAVLQGMGFKVNPGDMFEAIWSGPGNTQDKINQLVKVQGQLAQATQRPEPIQFEEQVFKFANPRDVANGETQEQWNKRWAGQMIDHNMGRGTGVPRPAGNVPMHTRDAALSAAIAKVQSLPGFENRFNSFVETTNGRPRILLPNDLVHKGMGQEEIAQANQEYTLFRQFIDQALRTDGWSTDDQVKQILGSSSSGAPQSIPSGGKPVASGGSGGKLPLGYKMY